MGVLSDPLNIVQHLFQIALHEEFRLLVTVQFDYNIEGPKITMMRQSTLGEFYNEFPVSDGPLWTGVAVQLQPQVLTDEDTLYETYSQVRFEIKQALDKGRVFV